MLPLHHTRFCYLEWLPNDLMEVWVGNGVYLTQGLEFLWSGYGVVLLNDSCLVQMGAFRVWIKGGEVCMNGNLRPCVDRCTCMNR